MYVKGTHHVVRRRAPLRTVLLTTLIIMISVWGGWKLFDFGRERAGFDSEEAVRRINLLEMRVKEYKKDNRALREQVALLERGRDIDTEAYARVEEDLQMLREEVSELQEQVLFYQGIVSPEDIIEGVQVKTLKLQATGVDNSRRYTLILTQGPKRAKRAQGSVTFAVNGRIDGKAQTLSFKSATGGKASSLKYAFKYFQKFLGDLVLPAAFEPESVLVTVSPSGKRATKVKKTFKWSEIDN